MLKTAPADRKNYEERYRALGFDNSSWARYCGTAYTTIYRHNQKEEEGNAQDIPVVFWRVLEGLERDQEIIQALGIQEK